MSHNKHHIVKTKKYVYVYIKKSVNFVQFTRSLAPIGTVGGNAHREIIGTTAHARLLYVNDLLFKTTIISEHKHEIVFYAV